MVLWLVPLRLTSARGPSGSTSALHGQRRLANSLVIAAFTCVFLANAWLGDDDYIAFRVVWNFLHGYGAVFNPGERVQPYTHPVSRLHRPWFPAAEPPGSGPT